jgi:regulator of cell morphogenesis and NO signaling
MMDTANIAVPQDTGDLIDHILTRFHQVHRTELSTLQPLAMKVEAVHADDPQVPHGLAQALTTLWREMEDHMVKEENILFPAMRAGGAPSIERPIMAMRADHDDHSASIALIRKLTADLTPPDHACGSWRSLYSGTAKLLDDLTAHIVLENDVLFPRFERR